MNKTIIAVVAIFLAAQAGLYMAFFGSEDQGGQARPAMAVDVMTLQKKPVEYKFDLPGRITPYRQSQVRPQVSGVITKRLFEEGAYVEKGQQLYQIDETPYLAALNSAKADLRSAKATAKAAKAKLNRYKELVKIDAVSRQENDDVRAENDQAAAMVAVAEASIAIAQTNFDYTKVYAPISGRIGRSFVTDGALVTANQTEPMAIITQLNPVYVDMQQSGEDIVEFRKRIALKTAEGAANVPVTLMLGGEKGNVYGKKGRLQFSEVTVDSTTGSIALRALFDNPDGILLPGLFVRAQIDLGTERELLVPQRATTRTPDGGLRAWVVDESNKAQPRQLDVVKAYNDQWIVRGGVKVGERLIMAGYQKVQPGMQVTSELWVDPNAPQTQPAQQPAAEEAEKPVAQERIEKSIPEAAEPKATEEAMDDAEAIDEASDEPIATEPQEDAQATPVEEEAVEEETVKAPRVKAPEPEMDDDADTDADTEETQKVEQE